MKSLVFYLVLRPLIKRNYKLRERSAIRGDGKYHDEWYWADSLACKWGYFELRSEWYLHSHIEGY